MSYAIRIADVMIGSISDSALPADIQQFITLCKDVSGGMGIDWSKVDSGGLSQAQFAMVIKGRVLDQLARASVVAAIGRSRGYLLPDDPLPRIEELNRSRRYGQPLQITQEEDDQLERAVYELSKIALAYDAGTLTFDRSSPAAQLAAFEVSVDGISRQSGDPLADILGYQPDGDFVKRKRALDALSLLDFSKRKPYLLFTADFIRDGRRQDGTVVCWQRMRDASAYTISRRDVFAMIDLPDVSLTNASLEASTAELRTNPEFIQVTSFYDWLGPDDYLAFVDLSTRPNTLYSYSLTGLQARSPGAPAVFDVPTQALYLSAAQIDQVREAIVDDLRRFGRDPDPDTASPYPAIARAVYGDDGQGWVLAGVNVLTSQRRGDGPDSIRRLTYVGARTSDVLSLASSGKLVVPADISTVHAAIDRSISAFGVSQTLLSVLDGTGTTVFISGKDDPTGLASTTSSALQDATGGLAKVLSTIDPQSAVIDPHVLAAALSSPTGQGSKVVYSPRTIPAVAGAVSRPSLESVLGDDPIDLTTYLGIARLMLLLRYLYDFFPASLT